MSESSVCLYFPPLDEAGKVFLRLKATASLVSLVFFKLRGITK